jgi:tetratricopeptide (TPR) repeat protein
VVERVCRSNENLNARSIVNNLPSSRLSDFIDRKELLEAVDLALSQSKSVPKSVVLIGMGGSGKTQLAIKYCQLRSSHGTTILWADASNEESLKRSFGVLAEMISKSLSPMKTFADTNSRVCYVKEVLQTMLQQWIIVFDNYDVPSAFENIFEFFPTFHNGEIIVTSRHPDSSRLGATVNVSGMHEEEALELLLRRTSLKRTSENERYAAIIVRRFGHLPLAIDQAGSYIRKQRLPLCDFTEHYNQQRRNVLNCTPLLWEYRKRLSGEEGESRLSVFTTWDLAFQQLEARKKSKEMKLIMLAGFLHHSSISEELFQAHYKNSYVSKDSRTNCQETASTSPGLAIEQQSWIEHFIDEENNWNSLKFRDTIIELHDLYLIQEFSSGLHVPCRFSLHPLVSDWIKLRGPGDQSQYYTKEAIHIVTSFLGSQFYSKTSPRTNQEILTHMDDCLTNAKEFLRKQNGIGYHSLNQSGVCFGKAYYEQGIYQSAEDVFRQVLEFSDVHRGHQHPDILQALHNLAMVCHSQGSHAEAEVLYKKSLEGRETRSEGDHLGTLQTIKELANVYCSQGRYADAGQLYHNVVESYKTQLGDGHPDSLKAILRLANNFRSQGDYSKAELLYQQAMEGLELCFGSSHPDLFCAVDDFGNNFQSQGRYAEAETLYLRALHGREMQLGRDHPDTQWTIANLANNYRSQGRYDEAESLYHRALVCNETQLGHDHPETLWIMDGLAAVYHAQCRYSEAETLFNRVLVCRERRLGCHHHNTLRTVNNLANVYHSQKLYAKAEELLRKSLDGREKHLGDSHPKTLGTVEDLATNLQCQGKLLEAATLFERTLKGRKELLSYNHPETLRTANKLLGLYRTQGRDTDVQLLTNEFPLLMERKEAPAMP